MYDKVDDVGHISDYCVIMRLAHASHGQLQLSSREETVSVSGTCHHEKGPRWVKHNNLMSAIQFIVQESMIPQNVKHRNLSG